MNEKVVRKKLADGTTKEYRYARTPASAAPVDTLGAVIRLYRAAPEWQRLAPKTRVLYVKALENLPAELLAKPIREVRRRDVLAERNRLSAKPGNAHTMLSAVGSVFKFAIAYEYVDASPVARVPRLPLGERKAWSWPEVEAACALLPERLRRAIILGVYTGQRLGDVLKMDWADIDAGGINVVQQKTGARLWLPIHPDLAAELAAWRAGCDGTGPILRNSRGGPWGLHTFVNALCDELAKWSLHGISFHGLRKTAAVRLAEAGCSELEIRAITGHTSSAMISHYTKAADQRVRATAAMGRLTARKTSLETA